ncbi:MAG: diguanylate cyclase [Candidatus Devosia phytovorans]|uniref:Diguanylate cyclase n=1 Tax=Candidatus Devosia phytovorans TaxID=3121372 RepID=A0AAJ5VUJ9_9HYPH|nr:diguanylate cyclase [Devosia sp.]WEK03738.1 MAG: diguanylate cyclase [Devosia sp.]
MAAEAIRPEDFDPRTRTLKWDRFMAMIEAERDQGPGALLLIDLTDQSRMVAGAVPGAANDVLPLLAQALRAAIRADDLVAHSDGYRFVILLRGASEQVGKDVRERVIDSVEDTIFITHDGIMPIAVNVDYVDLKDYA